MSDTLRLRVPAPPEAHDALVADLAEVGFEAFETDGALGGPAVTAYAPVAAWTDAARAAVGEAVRQHGAGEPTAETIADRDWNAEWEASVAPVVAGPFVVAPTWADVPAAAGREVLRIDPKMAFGTGHHPTTRLCLRLLPDAVARGASVLDVGTGTGVLALAALRLGAATALGVDVDPWSVENGRENAARNGLGDRFEVREGSLGAVPERGFGLVVCNVIRSRMAPLLDGLVERAAPDAALVLSGLLAAERGWAVDALAARGYAPASEAAEAEWWGARFAGCADLRFAGGGGMGTGSGQRAEGGRG